MPRGLRRDGSGGAPAWRELAAESWANRSVSERALGVEAACRAAMQLLADAPGREARLKHADPVPASTRAHLRRLASQRD